MQNGIFVNAANEVTVNGFMARDYKSNGFFFTNLTGYTMNHLIARHTGVYGLYAFNTIGGRMINSEAYYANDGAFYIGQTPPQAKPVRTIVRNVEGWGSPLGFSATNMRYVTITKSRFYNNAAGIVPERAGLGEVPAARGQRDHRQRHLLEQLQLPRRATRRSRSARTPPRRSSRSAPACCCSAVAATGSRTTASTATSSPASPRSRASCCQKNPDAKDLQRNIVRNNQFGLGGTDINGSDVMYDGNGSDNCFSMAGVTSTFPADGSTFAGCGGPNAFSQSVQDQMLGFIGKGALNGWKKHPHPAMPGYTPLEVFK